MAKPASVLEVTHETRGEHRQEGAILYEWVHEVIDAESFRRAFADVWAEMQDRRLQKTTSIGALKEILNEDLVEELNGAQIGLEKL